MVSINQNFTGGEEVVFNIAQIPQISTDNVSISAITDTKGNLDCRIISTTVFGLTYNGGLNDFTSNIQINFDGISGFDEGVTTTFEIIGKIKKEPVRIYNPNDSALYVTFVRTANNSPRLNIYYSIGETMGEFRHYVQSSWTEYTWDVSVPAHNSMWIYSEDMSTWGLSYSAYTRITANNNIEVSGNVMSLIKGNLTEYCFISLFATNKYLTKVSKNFLPALSLTSNCYRDMFDGCSNLIQAPELPATTLADSCYLYMFQNCTSLTTAPQLPATTLTNDCYRDMFKGCTSLTTAPELSAMTLATNSYYEMFYNCTSLTTAPQLPAMTLANSCYSSMFRGCTSLTTAPALPATTLATYCYSNMFYGCTNLITAPELPATTLASSCYSSMFSTCSKLNYVKAMFTTTPSTTYTQNWVSGVAASGTFVKNTNATWDVRGENGVPNGWTIVTSLD